MERPECVSFVVNETPYACWEWNIPERNLEFLKGIDCDYFRYVADSNEAHIDGDDKHRAALAIRIAYSQALETLFALLGAAIQAPDCVVGWLLAYRNEDLSSLVRKLSGRQKVLARIKLSPTWENLAHVVHQFYGDAEKREWIVKGYTQAWARFAREFLDEKAQSEYNSIKHGLRARLGGFQLAFGIEEVPGQLAKPESMQLIGASQYGTSFFTRKKLEEEGRTNFRATHNSRNWVPANLLNGLHLLSWSIRNVVSHLQIQNGMTPEECVFEYPSDPKHFAAPWERSVGLMDSFDSDLIFEPSQISPKSKQEILDSYKN